MIRIEEVHVTSGNGGQPICAFEWTSCQVTKVRASHLLEYATGEITKEWKAPYLTRGDLYLLGQRLTMGCVATFGCVQLMSREITVHLDFWAQGVGNLCPLFCQ